MTNLSHNPQPLPVLREVLDAHPRLLAGLVGVVALVVFGVGLAREPHFVDESAYISQSYYADLLIEGRRDDPTWLEYMGYDLPPLPKYTIGLALRLEGFPRPGPSAARSWYGDTSRRFVIEPALVAARRPSVLFGAIGCVAIFALGAVASDARVGLIAAVGLMANPLYRMHARRAMSDVPSEAMILATAAIGLWAWKRLLGRASSVTPGKKGDSPSAALRVNPLFPCIGLAIGGGFCAGLAVLAKLNGALGGFVLAGWAVLGLALGSFPLRGRLAFAGGCVVASVVAFALFVALNPFLTAHPRLPAGAPIAAVAERTFLGRVEMVRNHRVTVSDAARKIFPRDALNGPVEKVKAVAVQGFGRFGPFGPRGWTDSTRRYDRAQDWGAWLWLPWVVAGLGVACVSGVRQVRAGEPPTGWAVAVQAAVALVTITAFIPLAWDRYFLSLQPGSALLGSIALVALLDAGVRLLRRGRES